MLRELRALLLLAGPLVVLRAGQNLMNVVDTLVAGRISPDAIAAVGLAGAAFFMVYVFPMGLILGLDPLVSQAVGAGKPARWEKGLVASRWITLAVALPVAGLVMMLPHGLAAMGQPSHVVEILRTYMIFSGLRVVPALFSHTYAVYLTAHGHTRPFVVITLAMNVLNLVLDLWFCQGGLGLPALGVIGIGASSLGCSTLELVLLRRLVRRGGRFDALWVRWGRPDRAVIRRILSVGLPVGLQYGLEVSAFSLVTLLVGLFGTLTLAGHQIALNFAGLPFTMALGISSAASVRVGQAFGRGDRAALRRAGWVALGVGVVLAFVTAALIALLRYEIAALYTADVATISVAAGFLAIAAVFQFADMTQAIGFGVLRGLGDTRVPSLINIVGYYLLGLPLGLLGAFVLDDDPGWMWWGLTVALSIAAVALPIRFYVLARRGDHRVEPIEPAL